jgi:hypothetical protein
MSLDNINKSFSLTKNKEVKYLNKDFSQYRDQLIQFAKSYFPNTYRDFNDTSPGMMFIEMGAYIGDVLSYYIDYQFKESLMVYAEERKNLLALARYLGYKVKAATPATTTIEIFQLIPATDAGEPNYKYALNILEGMQVASNVNSSVIFRTLAPVNFATNTQSNPTEITVYSRDTFGNPDFFLLRKTVNASAGQVVQKQVSIGTATPFYRIELENNVLDIVSIKDLDNNIWYEVNYLAQDLVLIDVENISKNDQEFSAFNDTVPTIMKTLRTSRKFIVGINPDNTTYLEFGGGTEAVADELIIPNLNLIGDNGQLRLTEPLDPSNFLNTKAYGQAPENTTLTITYIVGGGIQSNVNTNELSNINLIQYSDDTDLFSQEEQNLLASVKRSVNVNNIVPGTGGADSESDESIRQNGLASFMSQARAVTRDDYIVRAFAMPSKYGAIAKVYVAPDNQLDFQTQRQLAQGVDTGVPQSNNTVVAQGFNNFYVNVNNPLAINMYVLGYDKNSKLTPLNEVVISNLKQYLDKFRMLTDGINIIDGFIINIGVSFEIIVYKNYNKKDVLANSIIAVSNFFDTNNMSFNQPINLTNLELEIAKVEGVQSVQNVILKNLTVKDGDYSQYEYDIIRATKNKVVYPSLDPSVFEIKFPGRDISGRCL